MAGGGVVPTTVNVILGPIAAGASLIRWRAIVNGEVASTAPTVTKWRLSNVPDVLMGDAP